MAPSRRPLRFALAAPLLVLQALVPPAAASAQEVPPPEPDDGAVTVVGTGPLRRSRTVARVLVERVAATSTGVEIATALVSEVLWGEVPAAKRIRLLTHETGYFSRVSAEAVYFLDPVGFEERYACRAVVDLTGETGVARLAALRRCLAVETLPREERAAALRAVVFEGLGAGDAWTRRNAVRELLHLATVRPDAFSPGDARDIRRTAERERDRVSRPLLVEAVQVLARAAAEGRLGAGDPAGPTLRGAPLLKTLREDPDPKRRRAAAEAAGREGPAGESALRASLEGDADPGVRAAAAEALGRTGALDAAEDLLRAGRGDADPAVRTAAVGALGHLRAGDAVEALRLLAGSPPAEVAREALFALARIRTEEALRVLRAMRLEAAVLAGDEKAREARDLLDFLLSDDFLKQEEALRRLRTGE